MLVSAVAVECFYHVCAVSARNLRRKSAKSSVALVAASAPGRQMDAGRPSISDELCRQDSTSSSSSSSIGEQRCAKPHHWVNVRLQRSLASTTCAVLRVPPARTLRSACAERQQLLETVQDLVTTTAATTTRWLRRTTLRERRLTSSSARSVASMSTDGEWVSAHRTSSCSIVFSRKVAGNHLCQFRRRRLSLKAVSLPVNEICVKHVEQINVCATGLTHRA